MEKKKVYRIRRIGTKEFISVGYNNKSSWNVYPSAAINANTYMFKNKDEFEVVVFEYNLVEEKIVKLK